MNTKQFSSRSFTLNTEPVDMDEWLEEIAKDEEVSEEHMDFVRSQIDELEVGESVNTACFDWVGELIVRTA